MPVKKDAILYIGRHRDTYEIGTNPDTWDKHDGWDLSDDAYVTDFCRQDFEMCTGIKLRDGKLVRLDSIHTTITPIK